jgi:predicted enzyme related to lactoylglutathione lyase
LYSGGEFGTFIRLNEWYGDLTPIMGQGRLIFGIRISSWNVQLRSAMLYVKDLEQMKRFYSEMIGTSPSNQDNTDAWATFKTGPAYFSLHLIPTDLSLRIEIKSPPIPREDCPVKLIFEVKDVEAERSRLESLGSTPYADLGRNREKHATRLILRAMFFKSVPKVTECNGDVSPTTPEPLRYNVPPFRNHPERRREETATSRPPCYWVPLPWEHGPQASAWASRPNWQKLVDHLISDKEMLGGVRLTFRDLYKQIEKSADPTAALEAFLGRIPKRKTAQWVLWGFIANRSWGQKLHERSRQSSWAPRMWWL